MEEILDQVAIVLKVLLVFSPILAIVGILVFAREDEETEAAQRKRKCARS